MALLNRWGFYIASTYGYTHFRDKINAYVRALNFMLTQLTKRKNRWQHSCPHFYSFASFFLDPLPFSLLTMSSSPSLTFLPFLNARLSHYCPHPLSHYCRRSRANTHELHTPFLTPFWTFESYSWSFHSFWLPHLSFVKCLDALAASWHLCIRITSSQALTFKAYRSNPLYLCRPNTFRCHSLNPTFHLFMHPLFGGGTFNSTQLYL